MASRRKEILMGNEAIGLGLVENGCQVLASYPGTPSSEILPAYGSFSRRFGVPNHYEWSINEKVAYEVALAAAMAGKRAAVCMKQVGLNVAADPAMSSAYQGVAGGFLVISTDDPGPHSSQTEQDSRLFALFARMPVYDPATPAEARAMVAAAYRLSERFRLPVVLRPTTRVCHARQSILVPEQPKPERRTARFRKDPDRWAATPRTRYVLHLELNRKLDAIRRAFERERRFNREEPARGKRRSRLGIIAAGVPHGHLMDLVKRHPGPLAGVPVLRVATAFPLPSGRVEDFVRSCVHVLVLEESMPVIEYQIADRRRVHGRLDGAVPDAGEMTPEVVYDVVRAALERHQPGRRLPAQTHADLERRMGRVKVPSRHPSLCPGCPHRATFFAIRKAVPKAFITSDIGCYTLGKNQRAVDTVLDMGAGITLADGLHKAYRQDGKQKAVVATIGDSTFYHSGPAALLNAHYTGARFVLVILDNDITAMTGMQPTPGSGTLADGSEGRRIPLEDLVRGCGVDYVKVVNPYHTKELIEEIRDAQAHAETADGGMAVVISRFPCLINDRNALGADRPAVSVGDNCDACLFCQQNFDCPAMVYQPGDTQVRIDRKICASCGLCVEMCPQQAVVFVEESG